MTDATSRRAVLAISVACFLVILIRTAWVCDDAYITFRTVDNAFAGFGLRWNVAERVQAFTHPLWCLLLLAARPFVGTYWAALALSAASSIATMIVVLRLAPTFGAAAVGAAIQVSSMSYVAFSTSGLENPLTHLLLALFASVWLAEGREPQRTALLFGLTALLATNRLDTLFLVAPALLWHVWRERPRQWFWTAALGVLPFAAWEVFAVIYYGFPVPNTAYAKLQTGVGGWALADQGLQYLLDCGERDPLTVMALGTGLVVPWTRRRDRVLALGMLAYLLFVVRVGGDFMSGRFLTAPLVIAIVLIQRAFRQAPAWRWSTALATACGMGLLAVEPNLTTTASYGGPSLGRRGISEERKYYYPATGLLLTTRDRLVPVHQWASAGRKARQVQVQATTMDAVGFFAYEAGPRVHVMDVLGLGDPLLARLPSRLPPWRIGHFYRRAPDGYRETLESGVNQLAEPQLARYYDVLRTVVRGDIWSLERARAIVDLNLGRHDALVAASSYGPRLVDASVLATRVPDGTPWDAPGQQIIREGGLIVALTTPTRVRRIEISLDADDNYQVELWRGSTRIAAIAAPSMGRDRSGSSTRYLTVGRNDDLVDRVVVRAREGDRRCSVGFLQVYP